MKSSRSMLNDNQWHSLRIFLLIAFSVFGTFLLPRQVFSKTILSQNDLTFVGGFRMPSVLVYNSGLALRYVDGTLKLYSVVGGNDGRKGHVIEFSPPSSLDTTYPFTQVTSYIDFGDIYQDKLVNTVSNGSKSPPAIGLAGGATPPGGLFWDETDQRMYWTKVVGYNTTSSTSDASIGYSTLNDTTHTGKGVASWKLDEPAGLGGKGGRYGFSMCAIPSSFASTYLSGKRLAVGFGGGVSILSNGVPSFGPAVFAIDPPSLINEDHLDYLSSEPQELLSHWASTEKHWAIRNPLYPGLNHRSLNTGTTNYWFEEDSSKFGVWIDTGNKQGILIWALMGAGVADTIVTSVTSNSVFTVADAGDIQANDIIRIYTDYNPNPSYPFEQPRVASVVGNTITLATPTTGNFSSGAVVQAGDWYAGGGPSTTRYWTPLYIYDQDDLANTARDPITYPPYGIEPTSNSNFALEGINYPLRGQLTGNREANIGVPRGMAYDPATHYIYFAARGTTSSQTDVWVYKIDDPMDGTLLPPSSLSIQ